MGDSPDNKTSVYLINYEFLCRADDTNVLLDSTAYELFGILRKKTDD
jgi:hypothetical protein